MTKDKSFSQLQFFILWLASPLVSAWVLLRNSRRTSHITPYLLLSFFIGISFVVVEGSGSDSIRYSESLKDLFSTQENFGSYFNGLYSDQGETLDIYQPLLTWIVSRFTDNVHILFGLFALVFGFFWFNSILIARKLFQEKLGFLLILLFVFFAFINPIWNINGVRMWTAVSVFFYGLVLVHFKEKKSGYIFLIIPIFIHFSLIISLFIYLLSRLVPKSGLRVFFILYISTFFVGELKLQLLQDYFELLPGFVQSRETYLDEDYTESVMNLSENRAAHILLYDFLYRVVIVSMVSWIFVSKRKGGNSLFIRFFIIALIFCSFSNVVKFIPSAGRFVVLSNLIVGFSFMWFLSKNIGGVIPKNFKTVSSVVLLYVVIVQIRFGLDFFGIFLFFGNPIINLFVDSNIPIIDFIKSIF
jgi:hypothetical protein